MKAERLNTYEYIILIITVILISALQGCNSPTYSILPRLTESDEKYPTSPEPAETVEKDVTLIITGYNWPDTAVGIVQIDHEPTSGTGYKKRAEYKLSPGSHTVFYYFVRQGHVSVISSADLNISFSAKAGHVYEFKNYVLWDDEFPEKVVSEDFLTIIIDTNEDEIVAWESRGRGEFKEEVQNKTGLEFTEATEKKAPKTDSPETGVLSTVDNEVLLDFVGRGNDNGIYKAMFLNFIYKGNKYGIYFIVSRIVNEKLMSVSSPPMHRNGEVENTKKDFILTRLNDQLQREELLPLVEKIKSIIPDIHNQARIAISLVQNIPYTNVASYEKYPYGVLWEHGGACSEKSDLLLFLLRELGFDTATLIYKNENHSAVGIGCPDEYDLSGSGYCYVEVTTPKIITDNLPKYMGVGTLTDFTTINISDGIQLEGVEEEFSDKNLYYSLIKKAKARDGNLNQNDYNLYNSILHKYGME